MILVLWNVQGRFGRPKLRYVAYANDQKLRKTFID